jgi:hypothetical protein
MKVIKPTKFDKSTMLVSTTAVETVALYNPVTTYAVDAVVLYNDYIYVSITDGHTGQQPDISPTKWKLKEPGNVIAMFDTSVSTVTTSGTSLTVVVDTKLCNSLGLLNLTGTEVTITGTDGPSGPTVYSKTVDLDGTIITDWYDYFFAEYSPLTDLVLTDIPPYSTMRLTVTITSGSSVGIGVMTWVNLYTLGYTQYGSSVGLRDYSIKETDEYGNIVLTERSFSKKMTANIMVDNYNFNKVNNLLTDIRTTPSVFIGSEDSRFNQSIVFGYYKEYSVVISYPTMSMCSLEIEGLI